MTQQISRIWLLAGALSVCGFTLACESSGNGDEESDASERDGSRPEADTNPSLDTGTNPGLDLGLGDTATDTTDTGAPAEEGISCGAIIQCINGTDGSQAAAQGCISQGTPTGQSLIQDVFACLQTNCASATTDAEFATCQQQFCASDLQACSSDNSDGGGPVTPPAMAIWIAVVSCSV